MKKRYIVLILFFSMIGLIVYAFLIEPKRIVTRHYDLGNQDNQTPVTVVQISDIHIQEHYPVSQLEKIVARVNAEQPDIILFTGDLFDNYAKYGPVDEVITALSTLNAPLGKFAVWGNHDYGGGASRIYPDVMAASGFELLVNSGVNVPLETGKSLYIAGLDDSLLSSSSITDSLVERQSDYTILLSHEPDVADEALNQEIQLILSGHSHGGQINLPFLNVTNALAEKYVNGFYNLPSETTLYVNTGLGTTKIPARFRVPPEIAVFQLFI